MKFNELKCHVVNIQMVHGDTPETAITFAMMIILPTPPYLASENV